MVQEHGQPWAPHDLQLPWGLAGFDLAHPGDSNAGSGPSSPGSTGPTLTSKKHAPGNLGALPHKQGKLGFPYLQRCTPEIPGGVSIKGKVGQALQELEGLSPAQEFLRHTGLGPSYPGKPVVLEHQW